MSSRNSHGGGTRNSYGGSASGAGGKGHRPPPVGGSKQQVDRQLRAPRAGTRYADDRVGVGAPRSTIGAAPIVQPRSSGRSVRQQGHAPRAMPAPRMESDLHNDFHGVSPSGSLFNDGTEGVDNYFSRSLLGDDVEMHRMVPKHPIRNTNRYEAEPDDATLASDGSPGTALPHEMMRKQSSSQSDVGNDNQGGRRDSTKSMKAKKSGSIVSRKASLDEPKTIVVKVKVPKGARPGDTAEFLLPGGRRAHIKVPKGARVGAVISVKVPKMGDVFTCVHDTSDLTNAEIARAEDAFRLIDHDNSGNVEQNEIRLMLMEMGMDSSQDMIDEMLKTFDKNGDGALSLDEFKLVCANCPVADVDWTHLDHTVLERIEKAARGDGHAHEGYAETSAFMRGLDRGMHFSRLDRMGEVHNASIRLSVKRDGLTFQFSGGRHVVVLPLESLWAVEEPFADQNADTLGLIPPEVAPFTILLVFAMKTHESYASTIAAGDGYPPGVSPTPSSMAAMKLGTKYANSSMYGEASTTPFAVSSPKQHLSLMSGLSAMDPLKVDYAKEGEKAGRAVLILIADSVDIKNKAYRGFKNLLYHHEHHIKKDAGEGIDIKTGRKFGGKVAKNPGRFDRYLTMFHHLYRPHHHVNHPPARFHTGIMAEVAYDEGYSMSVDITVGKGKDKVEKSKDILLPSPVFRPHMYVVAKIKKYDRETGTYDLKYASGPYLADENPDGTVLFNPPASAEGAHFYLRGVKQSLITVDMYDNYGSHQPVFILGISFIQCACFAYWVIVKEGGVADEYSPISGPEWSWLRIIGDMDDGCPSLRYDYWRYITYQFVHNGLVHIFSNMFMQLLFGLPLNMVHGSLRFGLIYELGVMFGALTFVTFDGGHDSVVGCSGGVYCIFGMHFAEIVTNWSLQNKGLMNHWVRLLIMSFIIGLDIYKIYTSPSETTSYSAHGGGILAGYLCGIIFLDTLETTWFHRYIGGPLVWLLVILLPVCMVAYYMTEDFPPPPIGALFAPSYYEHEPCCFQARACSDIDSKYYDAFVCQLGGISEDIQTLYNAKNGDELRTCADMRAAVNETYFS